MSKRFLGSDKDREEYQLEASRVLLEQIFSFISEEERVHGWEFADEFAMTLVQSFIATFVHKSLTFPSEQQQTRGQLSGDAGGASEDQQFDATWDSYRNAKSMLESAIALGFAAGLHAFNPNGAPDFQCQICMLDDGIQKGKAH
jgi:hypothetical protein